MERQQLTLESGFRSEAGHAVRTDPVPQIINPYRIGRVGPSVSALAETHATSIAASKQALGRDLHDFSACPSCIANGESFRAQVRQLIGEKQ